MRAVFHFGVLGPLAVERDGVAVEVSAARQRTLLAVLLGAAGPLSRDRLIDAVWGEWAPATAVSAVHVHLSRLRTRLGGDVLVLDSSGYRLDADQYGLDAREFDDLVARARAEPADSPRHLRQALDLVRGEPLSDVEGEGLVPRTAPARRSREAGWSWPPCAVRSTARTTEKPPPTMNKAFPVRTPRTSVATPIRAPRAVARTG